MQVEGTSFLIGRGDDCQLKPRSDEVSRRHCAIQRDGKGFIVRDCNSRNGTFIDGKRFTEPVPLADGAMLRVGPLLFQAEISVEASRPSADSADLDDSEINRWLDDGSQVRIVWESVQSQGVLGNARDKQSDNKTPVASTNLMSPPAGRDDSDARLTESSSSDGSAVAPRPQRVTKETQDAVRQALGSLRRRRRSREP